MRACSGICYGLMTREDRRRRDVVRGGPDATAATNDDERRGARDERRCWHGRCRGRREQRIRVNGVALTVVIVLFVAGGRDGFLRRALAR